MLEVRIITVGKLKEKYLRDACDEYLKRLRRFGKVSVIEIDEYRLPENPSEKEIGKALDAEGDVIAKNLSGYIIPMCIEGKQLSSTELADKMEKLPSLGQSCISFVIGSSFGLSDKIKNRGDLKLSMSKMTFPHQLARIMLLEQVYRGFQINGGGKYHK